MSAALRTWVAVLVLVLTMPGCSADPATSTPSATPAATGTRSVTDAEDTAVTVPADPQRVVVLSEPTLDAALALGITPVGTASGRGQSEVPNYLKDQAGDIPVVGSISQPNYEAIGALAPDLILIDGTAVNNNPPVIEALRAIAPTVYTGFAGGDWRDNLRFSAEALNKTAEAEEIINAYDARVAEAAPQLAGYSDATFSIVRWQGNSASLILKELLPGRALTDLGLNRPENQDRFGRGHSEPVSLENLSDIDADYIFFGTLGGSSSDNPDAGGSVDIEAAKAALAAAIEVPGFTSLKAHQDDHIVLVDGSVWTSTGGPLLMNRLIDDILGALT